MKTILFYITFCFATMLPFSDCDKNINQEITIASKSIPSDTEEKESKDIKSMNLEYYEHADRFEYNGREYLYSKLKFIHSNDYTYFVLDEDKKEISITRISNAKGEVTIPDELDGYQVVCLGVLLSNFSAYEEGLYNPESQYSIFEQKDLNNVTNLIIPEGIEHIGINAFRDMTHLTKVSLPDSLKTIGVEAFANTGIEELVLPKNLELIDMHAFYRCNSLAKVIVNSSNVGGGGEYPSFSACDNIELVIWGNVENADVDLFALSMIKRVIIPSSVRTLVVIDCNVETLIIEGQKTDLVTDKELGEMYWNDKFSIIIPEASRASNTIKGMGVDYKVVTLPKILSITKAKITSNDTQKTRLTWKKQSNTSKYQIYYSETKNGEYQLLKETQQNTFTTAKLKGYVKVRTLKSYQGVNWYGEFKLVKL